MKRTILFLSIALALDLSANQPPTVIQTPQNSGTAIQGCGTVNVYQNCEKPSLSPNTSINQFKIIGLGKSLTNGEYVIKLTPPNAEKEAIVRVEGDKPLTITLSDFPNNVFYSNLYDSPPTLEPNKQVSFKVGLKLSLILEKPQPQYQFMIESGNQKIPLIIEMNDWVDAINLLLETLKKQLLTGRYVPGWDSGSFLPHTPREAQKAAFELAQAIFPKNSQLTQIGFTAQALQQLDRPEVAALAYFEAEKVKTGITEQILADRSSNPEIYTEIGKLYLSERRVAKAKSWFYKAAKENYEPAHQQLTLLYRVDKSIAKAEETPIPEVKLAGDDPKTLVASLLMQNCKDSQCKAPKREIPVQILFKLGSTELEESAKQKLLGIGEELKKNSSKLFQTRKLQINGHTDSKGNPEENRSLSQERAKVVLNFLVEKFNLPPDRIEFQGYGSSELYTKTEATPEDYAKNRRIGFKMIYEGEE